jgi:hypothetical protein
MVRCGTGDGDTAQSGCHQAQQQQDLIAVHKGFPYSFSKLAHSIASFL